MVLSNHSDQLVCRWLFSHELLFFLDGRLNKVMNKNSMGDHYLIVSPDNMMELQAIEFVL
jgi:hypothetical protein